MKQIVCSLCLAAFDTVGGLRAHLSRRHGDVLPVDRERCALYAAYGEAAVENEVKRYTDGKCTLGDLQLNVRNYIVLQGLKRSPSEERKTPRYKTVYEAALRRKYGDGITNISQVTEVQHKKEVAAERKYGSYAKYMASFREAGAKAFMAYATDEKRKKAALAKAKNTFVARYGTDNPSKVPAVRSKIKTRLAERWSSATKEERLAATKAARDSQHHAGIQCSKLEHMVWGALNTLGVCFEHNVRMFSYSWDVVIPQSKTFLEVHGDYWHAYPGLYPEGTDTEEGRRSVLVHRRDARKHQVAEEHGWCVRVLWEHTIRSATDLVAVVSALLKGDIHEA